MAVQDRRERLPLPPPLLVAARADREPERLRRDRGGRPRAEPAARRADRDRGCARFDAGAAAARDSPARVAGALLPRDLGGARRLAVRRRDADLPRPPLARPGARAAGAAEAEAEAEELSSRAARDRPRHDRGGREDAARGERRGQGDRRSRRGHGRRHRGERDAEARGPLAAARAGDGAGRAQRCGAQGGRARASDAGCCCLPLRRSRAAGRFVPRSGAAAAADALVRPDRLTAGSGRGRTGCTGRTGGGSRRSADGRARGGPGRRRAVGARAGGRAAGPHARTRPAAEPRGAEAGRADDRRDGGAEAARLPRACRPDRAHACASSPSPRS